MTAAASPPGTRPPARLRRGQGNTEFIIIVALVAIGTISLVTLFGGNLRRLFGASTESLSGAEQVEVGASRRPGEDSAYHKNLQSFGQNGGAGGNQPQP